MKRTASIFQVQRVVPFACLHWLPPPTVQFVFSASQRFIRMFIFDTRFMYHYITALAQQPQQFVNSLNFDPAKETIRTTSATYLMKLKFWILSFGESINMDCWESEFSILGSILVYTPECIYNGHNTQQINK